MLIPITADRIAPWFPARERKTHKGDYGRILVIAGSAGMMGAAVLCAKAALRSGAGLVTVACDPASFPVIHCGIPEAMCCSRTLTAEDLKRYDTVAIGPGLSVIPETVQLLALVLENHTGIAVVDADALNAAAAFRIPLKGNGTGIIITPHEGEAGRLLRIEPGDVTADREGAAVALARTNTVCCVLKGADTLVADPEGALYVNTTGNPGMATAGAGDVLTGVIAACAAQMNRRGPAVCSSAVAGVFIHGLAGDLAAGSIGQYSLMAGDIVSAIPGALRRITEG